MNSNSNEGEYRLELEGHNLPAIWNEVGRPAEPHPPSDFMLEAHLLEFDQASNLDWLEWASTLG